ncbi:tRNA (adenosine(37)-N6)-threonylcarbamoyltransferase complex dimerization subunit type 1 TsaB [Lactobacillus sp. ESL0259]|uniref:tRNA (adenosine(37)-N6)-threonylcarbamoyltransferase complex dimerization subunit type 1 TsaB n=1 Tax=Lactobacillus sp. ESL0259 TaxID=2069346 RepID=UPI000EFA4C47|nr:tRNA (adenosine(37)-N6)-threonylcarbamoyltransferase complex dimerization subunit type 1 TsaB [Lactobacillus sp. ESL0259]RMC59656.1 tRNA (adenosine(37)-N6)-threonylcarbamoyltransferase complex dimerization subunit type 1 TsaB [Lactobacillus sp. ESL0259]
MKILSMSTATNNLSVALNDAAKVIMEKNEFDQRNHSAHLDPLIAEILKENNLRLAEIDRFAVAIGPGSYTGLRIGVTTVKMFASILHKEVVSISTLQALAASCAEEGTLIVAGIDARNDNYFAGAYVNKEDDWGPECVIPDGHYHIDTLLSAIAEYCADNNLENVIYVGSGFEKQKEAIKKINIPFNFGTEKQNIVHAGLIGKLAVDAQPDDPDQLLPNYLRRTQAEIDWHKKTGEAYKPDSNYVEEV